MLRRKSFSVHQIDGHGPRASQIVPFSIIYMYLVYTWCRVRVSGVLADITKSPIAIKTEGSRGLYAFDTTKQQQKQIYRLRNVRAGYVLYRALVHNASENFCCLVNTHRSIITSWTRFYTDTIFHISPPLTLQ